MLKIPPDITFYIQIGLFVILWMALKRLWFDPALRIIQERAARSGGALAEARSLEAEVAGLRREHALAIETAKGEAQREMQDILRRAEAEQKRLIEGARDEARRTLAEARSRVAEEVAAARRTLQDSAGEIAQLVARKVLGRPA